MYLSRYLTATSVSALVALAFSSFARLRRDTCCFRHLWNIPIRAAITQPQIQLSRTFEDLRNALLFVGLYMLKAQSRPVVSCH